MKLARVGAGDGGACMRLGCTGNGAWTAESDGVVLGYLCGDCAVCGPAFVQGLLIEQAARCLHAVRTDRDLEPDQQTALLQGTAALLFAAAEAIDGGPW